MWNKKDGKIKINSKKISQTQYKSNIKLNYLILN